MLQVEGRESAIYSAGAAFDLDSLHSQDRQSGPEIDGPIDPTDIANRLRRLEAELVIWRSLWDIERVKRKALQTALIKVRRLLLTCTQSPYDAVDKLIDNMRAAADFR